MGFAGRVHPVLQMDTAQQSPAAPHDGIYLCSGCIAYHGTGRDAYGLLCQWRTSFKNCICNLSHTLDILYCDGIDQSKTKKFQSTPSIHDPQLCSYIICIDIESMEICNYQYSGFL